MTDEVDARRRFAAELRSHRELYGEQRLTQVELAKLAKTSKSTISRLESTEEYIPPDIPRRLDEVFGTDGLFTGIHEEIEAHGFPAHSRRRLALETDALEILEWSPTVVPGLLQSPLYAYALLREGLPRASEAEVQNKVRQRLERQELWKKASPPDLSVVVCESVIRRRVGKPDTMREQLSALLRFAGLPTVLFLVLPLDAGTHSLMDGSLSILTTPNSGVIAYTEGVRSGAIIEAPGEVRALTRSYDVLTASALSRERSTRMIQSQLEAL